VPWAFVSLPISADSTGSLNGFCAIVISCPYSQYIHGLLGHISDGALGAGSKVSFGHIQSFHDHEHDV
jgi:hypothetical protein